MVVFLHMSENENNLTIIIYKLCLQLQNLKRLYFDIFIKIGTINLYTPKQSFLFPINHYYILLYLDALSVLYT